MANFHQDIEGNTLPQPSSPPVRSAVALVDAATFFVVPPGNQQSHGEKNMPGHPVCLKDSKGIDSPTCSGT